MNKEYNVGDLVTLKKGHPCGTNLWKIMKLGVDVRLKCVNCGRMVMIPRIEFNKKLKKVNKGDKIC